MPPLPSSLSAFTSSQMLCPMLTDELHIDGQWCEEECDECDERAYDDWFDREEAAATGN